MDKTKLFNILKEVILLEIRSKSERKNFAYETILSELMFLCKNVISKDGAYLPQIEQLPLELQTKYGEDKQALDVVEKLNNAIMPKSIYKEIAKYILKIYNSSDISGDLYANSQEKNKLKLLTRMSFTYHYPWLIKEIGTICSMNVYLTLSYIQKKEETIKRRKKFISKRIDNFLFEVKLNCRDALTFFIDNIEDDVVDNIIDSNFYTFPQIKGFLVTKKFLADNSNYVRKYSNGWFWLRMDCQESEMNTFFSDLMQHCGSDLQGDLYYLFDEKNSPHVTITYDKEENTIYQIRGKNNKTPVEKYWNYVKDFGDLNQSFFQINEPPSSKFLQYITGGRAFLRTKHSYARF